MNFLAAGTVGQRAKPGPPPSLPGKAARSKVALSMYSDLPEGEIAIEEFERFAMDRLRVLKGLDDAKAKGFRPDQLHEKALALYEAHLRPPSGGVEEAARRDVVSHFVLRLAYCRTEELRRWFLGQECDLFRARFRALLPSEQKAFMEANSLPFRPISADDYQSVEEGLHATLMSITGSSAAVTALKQQAAAHESFYKVPFELVPDLVGSRRVYLQGGHAYVSKDQISSLVVQPFRAAMSKALVVTARRWAAVVAPEEADRLTPVVESLSQRYLGPDYSDPDKRGVVGSVTAGDIPALARASMPLCMLNMYQALHESHHLKHDGRMQLGLFLKGIGLPLEEAIRFWRTEMAPVAPGDKFDKQYLYNVRHNYGKEGNRKDYTPYTCIKVISGTPGVGQVHGCPYKTFSQESLRSALGRMQVAPAKVEEAVSKAKAGHYQLACAASWEGKHGCACETGINHPNQYFEESRVALGAVAVDKQQQEEGGGAAVAAAAAAAEAPGQPRTPGSGGALQQLQNVLSSSGGPQPGSAKVQRIA